MNEDLGATLKYQESVNKAIPKPPLEQIEWKLIEGHPDEPTLIFLHDSLGCIELWRDFPRRLGNLANCTIIIYDRQGYGRSCPFSHSERSFHYLEHEADILRDLLDFWKVEKAVLFGHSDGGSIALLAAAKYPDRILGIITEGAHVFVEDITIQGITAAVNLYKTSDLKQKLQKYHGDKTEAMFWAWADTWRREDFRKWNIESFLSKIKCPAMIIQGTADQYGTMDQVESIVKQAGGSTMKMEIPNTGHSPHKEVPELILKASSQFIQKVIGVLNKPNH